MNFLFIAEKDAANASLGEIIKELKRRGHYIKIYAPFFSENVLRFFCVDENVCLISELIRKDIEDCDIIFASVTSSAFIASCGLFFERKPIFIQNYLIDRQVGWEGDICFVPSLESVKTAYDSVMNFARVGIGEPKYDNKGVTNCKENRLLFIDSGHYPFGRRAKQELAKTLLHICKEFPTYELWIKPRFLPQDKVVTHMQGLHLYEVIEELTAGKIPPNLIMLKEHYDLKEMINQSHTVLCMHTTAFVGACVADKGLVVLDGLPNEDTYDIREKVFGRIRETLLETGAVIHYTKVDEILPHGIKCSREYLKKILAETSDVAIKICEVTEYLYNAYYAKGKFPTINELSYENIEKCVTENKEMTWEKRIKERCKNYLMFRMLTQIDYRVKTELNVCMLYEKIRYFMENMKSLNQVNFENLIKAANVARDDCIICNADEMMNDTIDQGVLLNALYCRGRYDEIKRFENTEIGAYHMFRGFVAIEDEDDIGLAIAELEKYMKISLERVFVKEISDMSNNKMKAFYVLISLLCKQREKEKAQYYFNEMCKFYQNLYKTDPTEARADAIQKKHYALLYGLQEDFNELKWRRC